jgi:hypothetical protein
MPHWLWSGGRWKMSQSSKSCWTNSLLHRVVYQVLQEHDRAYLHDWKCDLAMHHNPSTIGGKVSHKHTSGCHSLWQNHPIHIRLSTAAPTNHVTRMYRLLYEPCSSPSVTKDLGKLTSQPRSYMIKGNNIHHGIQSYQRKIRLQPKFITLYYNTVFNIIQESDITWNYNITSLYYITNLFHLQYQA